MVRFTSRCSVPPDWNPGRSERRLRRKRAGTVNDRRIDGEGVENYSRSLFGLPFALVVFAILGLSAQTPAYADVVIDTLTTSVLLQSTISDADTFLLTQLVGFEGGQNLSYQSISDASGWHSLGPPGTPTLSGTYAGGNLEVTYDGNLSALPGGSVTWTGTGLYGSEVWASSGSAVITDTSPVTFTIDFLDSVSLGGNTGSFDVMIPGILDSAAHPSEIDYLAGLQTGTVSVSTKPKPFPIPTPGFTLHYVRPVETDFGIGGHDIIIDHHGCTPRPGSMISMGCGPGFAPSVLDVTMNGTISTTPEPATFVPLGLSLSAIIVFWFVERRAAKTRNRP